LFSITTDKQFDTPVTVTLAVTGDAVSGTDYTAIGTTVVFPAFTSSITIPVEVIADDLVESDETVTVSMTATSNTDVSIAAAPGNQATVTIADNDLARLAITATRQAAEDATDGLFTLSTDKQFDAPVTVTLAVTGDAVSGTDYTAIGTTVVFPAFTSSITIPVEVLADNLDENNETVTVWIIATGNADVTRAAAPYHKATVTITDNDAAPAVAFSIASSSGFEPVAGVSLQVNLSAISGLDVTVDYIVSGTASGGGTDYTLANGTLTINALSGENTIDITIVDDLLGEPDETVIVTLINPVNATLGASTVYTYVILDNDLSAPGITTQAVTGITTTSGTGNGRITHLGGFDVTAHGICWNTTGAPTISDDKTDIGATSETGTFTAEITDLAVGTTYFARAYATNAIGINYGNEVTFTTLSAGSWIGITSSAWEKATNWAGGSVPGAETDVIVPVGVPFYPVISETTTADCRNLTVHPGASLTIASTGSGTGSLIIHGSSAGIVTCQRYMTGDKWHLVSPPAAEGGISAFIRNSDNAIYNRDIEGRIRYAVVQFDEPNHVWDSYYTDDTSDRFVSGKGYNVRRITEGAVTFTGVLASGTETVQLSSEGKGWNCVGNPYSSAIKMNTAADAANNFLSANSTNLDPSYAAAYIWDGDAGMYAVLGNSGFASPNIKQDVFQSGQGFFVKAAADHATVEFNASMQVHQPMIGLKSANSSWPGFELAITRGEARASAIVAFNDQMTNGLDPTYDAGLLPGNTGIFVYTRLLEDNGIDFAVQCLPEKFDSVVIPVGIHSPADGEITFSAETPVPLKCSVILEDRLNRKFTILDPGIQYTTSVTGDTQGTGRFFIHTSPLTTGTAPAIAAGPLNLKVYPGNGQIYILGKIDASTQACLFSASGQALGTFELEKGDLNRIPAALPQGVYLLNIIQGSKRQTTRVAVIERF
jgi:hypothetical protein